MSLDTEALKVIDRQLTAHESWYLGWAVDNARKVKEAKKDKWSKVFMMEPVQ